MDSIISTFHIDWKIIIAQAVNFVIVFVVLYLYALKPLNRLMIERADKIKKGLDDAKKSDELFKKTAEEYERNAVKIRELSINAEKELKKELEQLRAKNLERIKLDDEEWEKKRKEQFEADKKALIEGAKNEIINLAMIATEKLIKSKGDLNNL